MSNIRQHSLPDTEVSIKTSDDNDNMSHSPTKQMTDMNSGKGESHVQSPARDRESPEPSQPPVLPPPPDSGFQAWIQCVGTFCLWFAVWGLVNSFGVFQAYFETEGLKGSSTSSISWIGSLQVFIFIAGTSIIGPVFDIGYLRTLLCVGSFFTVFGMMMTSLCHAYWQFILAQGVCMGLGMTCLFVPCVAVLPSYFSSRRALAVGIAATGSSIGAIIFTIIFQQLQPKAGFGWAVRCIGFILLASLALPVATMRKRIPRSPRRALIDTSALKEWPFDLTLCAMFVVFMGLYVPYFYIEVYSVRARILSEDDLYLNKYLIIFMNCGSLAGRLLPNILADRIGPFNTIIPMTFITGIIGFCWIAVTSKAWLIIFAVLYGFFSGSFVALTSVVWAALSPNLKVLGTRIGMMTVPMAIGLLIGNPIAGATVSDESFTGLQVFCGATVTVAGMFLLATRVAQLKDGAGLKG